jgi:hypothetical protein
MTGNIIISEAGSFAMVIRIGWVKALDFADCPIQDARGDLQ